MLYCPVQSRREGVAEDEPRYCNTLVPINGCTKGEKCPNCRAVGYCGVQRRPAPDVRDRIHVRAALREPDDTRNMAIARRVVQGRVAVLIGQARVRTLVQRARDCREVAAERRGAQARIHAGVARGSALYAIDATRNDFCCSTARSRRERDRCLRVGGAVRGRRRLALS